MRTIADLAVFKQTPRLTRHVFLQIIGPDLGIVADTGSSVPQAVVISVRHLSVRHLLVIP